MMSNNVFAQEDTSEVDLKYPFEDESNSQYGEKQDGGLYLQDPSNIKGQWIYDPESDSYIYEQKMGDQDYRPPGEMSLDEYMNYDMAKSNRDFWREKSKEEDDSDGSFRPKLFVEGKTFDRIFGGNTIDIRPQGSAEISFALNVARRDNPALPERQRRATTFDFNERIQLNVVGSVGEKLKISTSYNTEATFDFENQTKIEYTGYEDEIIQKIELGNVSLPLNGSLITGSQTLFGIKTELKFGRLTVTSIFSQERGERKEINVAGGSQITVYEKPASEYDENKHYFLSHFFRDRYEAALNRLPLISSTFQINKVEVWITQTGGQYQNTRNVIAFHDLGENDPYIIDDDIINDDTRIPEASNYSNDLYAKLTDPSVGGWDTAALRSFTGALEELEIRGLENGKSFEKKEALALLAPTEYTLNRELGYISLNRALNTDEVLGVAFQYTVNGRTYQVGEFSNDGVQGQNALYLKLLKAQINHVNIPMWDLQMKNVYSLGAFNVNSQDFSFEIWYLNPETGVEVPYIAEGPIDGKLLLQVSRLDQVDPNNSRFQDGVFDFLPGITINPNNGRVYFPVLEPFGSHLKSELIDPELQEKYAFDSLYSTTRINAEQDADHNRFVLRGQYQSASSSEISLNAFNIPQGSVTVTAGGIRLVENQDYTVDYNLGRVKILNEGLLEAGTPIKISLESNSLFNIQTRTLMGSHLDYRIDENLRFGGTILNLTERPLTNKVNMGDEAISNTIWGLDGSYSTESQLITKAVDLLPLIDTKEKSTLTATAEFAHLVPGNARAITKEGIAYIDDFEGSQSAIDLKALNAWFLASTPQGQRNLFPEATRDTSLPDYNPLSYGYNRSRTAWYVIDPLFFRSNDANTPGNITDEMRQNHYSREVLQTEVFPNRDPEQNLITNIPVLDFAFYPKDRGQYNYDPPDGSTFSDGLDDDGNLRVDGSNPRWGGMMREIQTPDFEATNVEFIQFWVMDPFDREGAGQDYEQAFGETPNGNSGRLYFNLGNVSEDILRDDRKSFENGFPFAGNQQQVDTTAWGRVPSGTAIVNAFDNNPDARPSQDVGLDGLSNAEEDSFHIDYVQQIENSTLTTDAKNAILSDVSADDFRYFRDTDDGRNENILERYKDYNGMENNSPVGTSGDFTPSSSTLPDIEDINRDNDMSSIESYYQYSIPVDQSTFNPNNVGRNFITDVIKTKAANSDKEIHWYQFKIPIRQPEQKIGSINDFKSIRFMRMFVQGFEKPVVLRFASLDLVRGEWRKYGKAILEEGQYIQNEPDAVTFETSAVNVEENSERQPINYVLPPGLDREIDYGTANLRQLNEQSLAMDICGLNDGETRAAYRNMDIDIRQYKRLKMFAHIEDASDFDELQDDELSMILRLGTDFEENYYEYEVPLRPSRWGNHSREAVWPTYNDIDLALEVFTQAKLNRGNSVELYEEPDGKNTVRVRGNPNLSKVKVIMIGVKNPKQSDIDGDTIDDGQTKCVEFWANELRLTEFDNSGGWAANALVSTQLANLGSMSLAGSMSTPGFGSIDQKLNERQQETRMQYAFKTNLELGMFAQNVVSVPMYFGYSESWQRPRYNPLDPDIEFKDLLASDDYTTQEKDSIKKATETYTSRKSINFTNVKKLPGKNKKKSRIYDVENLSATYAYNLTQYRDAQTEYKNDKEYRGGILYNYSAKPKNYQPFSTNKYFRKSPYFKIIRDFNFYLVPKQYSFGSTVSRTYTERKVRQTNPFYNPQPYYQKTFNWDRTYALRHDFTRALKFNFNAANRSLIEETKANGGRVDKEYEDEYEQFKDSVWQSIMRGGENMAYSHNFGLDYTLPINKLPYLEWVNVSSRYSATYNWDRAPIGLDSLGNTVRNTNKWDLNGQLNMNLIYNKVDYFKRLNQSERSRDKTIERRKKKEDEEKDKKKKGEGDQQQQQDRNKRKKDDDPKRRKLNATDYTSKILLSLKDVSGTYSISNGTILPGYSQDMQFLGFDPQWDAPGLDFVAGAQKDPSFVREAYDNGWMEKIDDSPLVYNFSNTYSKTYNYRATFRPFKTLRVEFNGNYLYAINQNNGFFWNDSIGTNGDIDFNPVIETGNFSASYITWQTSFIKDDRSNYSSETFAKFLELRRDASRKLADQRAEDGNYTPVQDSAGFYSGYGGTSQEVLITSFLAAYTDQDEVDIAVNEFKKIFPKPNWRITYDGLNKIKLLDKWFRSVTLNHAYRSTYNINSFVTNPVIDGDSSAREGRDISNNFIPEYQISTVSITEQYSPLFGINIRWKSIKNFGTRLEFKRDRNISLSLQNNQITEVKGREWVIGLDYKFPLNVTFNKNRKAESKDLTTRLDISSRSNTTIIRRIVEQDNQPAAGQQLISIKLTGDLAVSTKLNLRVFYDRIMTNPFISNAFPTANTNAGVSLRFSLSQ